MTANHVAWPTGMSDQDPAARDRPLVFNPQGFLVAILEDADHGTGLRRVTGWLLVIGAVAFAVAATVLSSTFEWPDILREPPQVVLPAFVAGGTSLVWTSARS